MGKTFKIMSTRAQIRFATREEGVTFSEHPEKFHAQFYKHSDGYPEGLGVDIAESLLDSEKLTNWEIEYLDTKHSDLDYIYYIWQTPGKTTWISIFKYVVLDTEFDFNSEYEWDCIFVGEPQKLLDKYKHNTNTNG